MYCTCLLSSYYNVYKCVQINGELTLGENIADNGGIHTSFQVCGVCTGIHLFPLKQFACLSMCT